MWEGLELSRNSCSGGTQAQQGFRLSRGPGSRGNQAEQGLRLTLLCSEEQTLLFEVSSLCLQSKEPI